MHGDDAVRQSISDPPIGPPLPAHRIRLVPPRVVVTSHPMLIAIHQTMAVRAGSPLPCWGLMGARAAARGRVAGERHPRVTDPIDRDRAFRAPCGRWRWISPVSVTRPWKAAGGSAPCRARHAATPSAPRTCRRGLEGGRHDTARGAAERPHAGNWTSNATGNTLTGTHWWQTIRSNSASLAISAYGHDFVYESILGVRARSHAHRLHSRAGQAPSQTSTDRGGFRRESPE